MFNDFLPYALSAIGGGVAVCVPWYVVARIWDRNRTYLLSENARLDARVVHAESKLAAEKFENESLANTCDMLRKANAKLLKEAADAKAKSWMSQLRDPVTKQFGAKVAA